MKSNRKILYGAVLAILSSYAQGKSALAETVDLTNNDENKSLTGKRTSQVSVFDLAEIDSIVTNHVVVKQSAPVVNNQSEGTLFVPKAPIDDQLTANDLFKVVQKVGDESGISGSNFIKLPNNGMIWITEDLNVGKPELSISAPSYVAVDSANMITKPVEFFIRSNYSSFVDQYKISIYRGTDRDQVNPIVEIPVETNGLDSVSWDGQFPSNYRARVGDTLIYVLRAYDGKGNFDETFAKEIVLVTEAQADSNNTRLRDNFLATTGEVLSQEQAITESLTNNVESSNDIYRQNIPLVGSKVTIQGSNVSQNSVKINGDSYSVDLENKFSTDFIVPIGKTMFNVEVDENNHVVDRDLTVEVSGDSFFAVGIADLTVYQNKATGAAGNSVLLNAEGQYDDSSVLADGRLAFYTKGRVGGKYTFVAQADTTQRDIKHMFSGFGRSYPEDVFRILDPNLYYPTYGDDSSVYRDVDTMGRFYARLEWNKNQALWGNYNTGFSGSSIANYSRSLYGAAVDINEFGTTKYGDTTTHVRAFASQVQSVPSQIEFLATGGSLYYLRELNILPGSDIVRVEVRDPLTGLVVSNVTLTRGVDYEINNTQGRIILTRPLSQIVNRNSNSIINENPAGGDNQYLVVNYEHIPNGFDPDHVTAGIRAKQWLGDHVAIGGTYVKENQDTADYELKGGDITFKAGKGTYLKAEYAKSESVGSAVFFSNDGGLNFRQTNNTLDPRQSGEAKSVEARVNFQELGATDQMVALGGWYREIDAGFSSNNEFNSSDKKEYGAELSAQIVDDLLIYSQYSSASQDRNQYEQAQVSAQWRFENDSTLTGEVKHVKTESDLSKATGTLVGMQYSFRVTEGIDMYVKGQVTVDNDNGNYATNNSATVGLSYDRNNTSTFSIEATGGTRGHNITLGMDHKFSDNYSTYVNYQFSDGTSDYDTLFGTNQSGLTFGQRWQVTDRLNVHTETQQLKSDSDGLINTIGLDYSLGDGWTTNFTFQDSRVKNKTTILGIDGSDTIHRVAISAGVSRTTDNMDWSSKLEYRKDSGSSDVTQWLTTNKMNYKVTEGFRVSGKFNYSKTNDYTSAQKDAKFTEASAGFAWRPTDTNKYALLGRYTYLYDDTASVQSNSNYNQKSNIFSLEGIYKHDANWEFGAKVAYRDSSKNFGYMDRWFDSSAKFAAGQVRYDLIKDWHVLAEYRWLDTKDSGTKQGALIGVDYDITDNLRFGVGYNFTDFSDDLRNQDYKYKGFFLNVVGYF